MSLTTILTILLLIIACVLPFVIIKRRDKRAEKKIRQILLDHASNSNHSISQHELLNQKVIGIADATNRCFFLKRFSTKDVIHEVDLNTVERCYINKTTRNSIDGNYSATERIELRFASQSKTNPEVVFELYNLEQDSLSMSGELQLAEKWKSIIDKKLLDKKSKMDQ
jgi:hypothetical protein